MQWFAIATVGVLVDVKSGTIGDRKRGVKDNSNMYLESLERVRNE